MNDALFSIGYATKPLDTFLAHLNEHGVSAIADIRSVPYSNAFFDFHREALQRSLREAGIRYVYLGTELGPRSKNPAHYDATGQVQFDRLAASALYRTGIARLKSGLGQGFRIALMCAEKRPEVCHRSLLVGYHLLREDNLTVTHIQHDGARLRQDELEAGLAAGDEGDLFASVEDQLRLAIASQWQRHAYRRPATPAPP